MTRPNRLTVKVVDKDSRVAEVLVAVEVRVATEVAEDKARGKDLDPGECVAGEWGLVAPLGPDRG